MGLHLRSYCLQFELHLSGLQVALDLLHGALPWEQLARLLGSRLESRTLRAHLAHFCHHVLAAVRSLLADNVLSNSVCARAALPSRIDHQQLSSSCQHGTIAQCRVSPV